jgi:hypothetical protein
MKNESVGPKSQEQENTVSDHEETLLLAINDKESGQKNNVLAA